ncbi:MAG: PQQ-binding-like beta-propeller repeat protein, partial [Armatimonadota bacterium]
MRTRPLHHRGFPYTVDGERQRTMETPMECHTFPCRDLGRAAVVSVMAALACCCTSVAADWPTWLGDASRSGSSEEQLPNALDVAWAHKCRHAPSPAIPVPHGEARRDAAGDERVQTSSNDNAHQVVVAGGKLYFGSSTEETVTCLDARSGEPLWVFYCEGAVRFAPLCHDGKVYFGSDDGYVYCVDGASGEQVWKFQAAKGDRRIIANQRISSQWPVRTGLTIRDDIVYAACGIFPSEDRGVVLYALGANDGKPIWKQRLLIHAVGHLLAEETSLIIPAGRAAPLDVQRADGGRPGYTFQTRRDEGGGSPCVVADMLLYGPNENGFIKVRTVPEAGSDDRRKAGIDRGFGASRVPGCVTGLQGWRMVADGERIYVLRNDGLHALDRLAFAKALVASSRAFDQRSKEHNVFLKRHQQSRDEPVLMEEMKACTKWRAPNEAGLVSMVRAGRQIITGGKGLVQAHDAEAGESLWSAKVEGTVWDLAVADGAVFASTDAGVVCCLRADGRGVGPAEPAIVQPFEDDKQTACRGFVERVLERADTKKGYCVIAGMNDGRLAFEIARQSEFFVLGIESDPERVVQVRRTLSKAGLYGKRVSIHERSDKELPYLSYFANVVLSESMLATGEPPCPADALFPLVQPCGGLMVMAGALDAEALREWGRSLDGWRVENRDGLTWGEIVRPKLEGSGEWTHMFANPANTLSSGDRRVGGTRYDIQWIGPPGSERQWGWHYLSMTALYKDGRMYLTRRDHVMAVDA